jgi:hypothetical protein
MAAATSAMACRPEEHWRLTVRTGTTSGMPGGTGGGKGGGAGGRAVVKRLSPRGCGAAQAGRRSGGLPGQCTRRRRAPPHAGWGHGTARGARTGEEGGDAALVSALRAGAQHAADDDVADCLWGTGGVRMGAGWGGCGGQRGGRGGVCFREGRWGGATKGLEVHPGPGRAGWQARSSPLAPHAPAAARP